MWDLRPLALGPVFANPGQHERRLFISVGSLVASVKSLSGLGFTPAGAALIDSLSKEDKSGTDP